MASTSDAGPSRCAAGDIMSLLDDAMLDTDHVAMQMESHCRFGIYVEVILSTLRCRVPIVETIHLSLMPILFSVELAQTIQVEIAAATRIW